MFVCLIVLKLISSSGVISLAISRGATRSNRHAGEPKRTRRDLTYQNSLGNQLMTHQTMKNSVSGPRQGISKGKIFWMTFLLDFPFGDFQAMIAQEKFAAQIALQEAAKAKRQAKQQKVLNRISQLKRVCICRLYCRGEFLTGSGPMEDRKWPKFDRKWLWSIDNINCRTA